MHRIEGENLDTETGVALFKDTPPYTVVKPAWLNSIQEEILKVITDAGLHPLDSFSDTMDQLAEAIAIGDLSWVLTVGDLTDLDTTDKSSIVNAINELAALASSPPTKVVSVSWLAASGVSGGTATSGGLYDYDTPALAAGVVATLEDDQGYGFVSLNGSNHLVVSAGTYKATILVPFFRTDNAFAKLVNASTSAVIVTGCDAMAGSSINSQGMSIGEKEFVLTGSTTLQLVYRVVTTRATDGLGNANGVDTGKFASIILEKLS